MVKHKKPKKRGYISKFLEKADEAISAGIKDADKAFQEGIKKADEALDAGIDLGIISTKQARKEAQRYRKAAQIRVKQLQKQAKKEANRLKNESRKKIKEKIATVKIKSSSRKETLLILVKLGRLRKTGVITEKEFQKKKKELLKGV